MGPDVPVDEVDGSTEELRPSEERPELGGGTPPVVKLDPPILGRTLDEDGEGLNGPVVVRSVVCVVDSLVAMVVTHVLITAVGELVVRTALLEPGVETAAGAVGEELMA